MFINNTSATSPMMSFTDDRITKGIVLQGFVQDFFLGGEHLCGGKLIRCGIGCSLLGGSGGKLPQKNFELLSPLRVI